MQPVDKAEQQASVLSGKISDPKTSIILYLQTFSQAMRQFAPTALPEPGHKKE